MSERRFLAGHCRVTIVSLYGVGAGLRKASIRHRFVACGLKACVIGTNTGGSRTALGLLWTVGPVPMEEFSDAHFALQLP